MKLVKLTTIIFLFFSAALLAHQNVTTKTQSTIVNTSDRLTGSNKTEKFDLMVVKGAGKHSLLKDIQLKSGQIRLRRERSKFCVSLI